MEIVVTSNGNHLEKHVSPVFGRCTAFVFVDTETMHFEAVLNPEGASLRGAGFQAAKLVVEHGAQAVVSGNVGPNAFGTLQTLGVPVYLCREGQTVREAVDGYKAGLLHSVGEASVSTHTGTRQAGNTEAELRPVAIPSVPSSPFASREEEISALEETAKELRDRLSQVLERLDHLGNGS